MASAMSKATTSRIMKNLDHLKNPRGPMSVRIAGARKRNPLAPRAEDVHPANRIKWWNIVPGDQVRLVRGPFKDPDRVVEVLSINKFRNLVMFKDLTVCVQYVSLSLQY
jgi:transcription antitermination factor NusG